ncbi:uncharacterized protein LOC129694956, partial [Leucoraja erinacea]|uniref:uncharacterized protein LOC129694956 n=1 Tax=Leucoraja erinaceus TaxID=7782 RepID=UPI0024590AED
SSYPEASHRHPPPLSGKDPIAELRCMIFAIRRLPRPPRQPRAQSRRRRGGESHAAAIPLPPGARRPGGRAWRAAREDHIHGTDQEEIVNLLLNKGVSPNNEEDSQCGGTTVLHDALANGFLSVAHVLVDNGASLTAQDSEGRTPADSLISWMKNLKEPDPEVMHQCEGMLARLNSHGTMESELTICITDVHSLVPNEAKLSSLASSPSCQRPSRTTCRPQRPSASAADRSRSRSGQRDGEESEREDGYPWLRSAEWTWSPEAVLDETPGPSGGVSQEEPGQESSSLTVLGHQDPGGTLDGEWLEVERKKEAGSSKELDRSCLPREQTTLDPSPSRSPSPPAEAPMDEGSRSPTEAQIQTPGGSAAPSLPPTLRVRVCVLDKVFLIPVSHSPFASPTVSWLATEAAGRSALIWGYRPQLTLTSHRAILSPDDLLTHTLRDNEQPCPAPHQPCSAPALPLPRTSPAPHQPCPAPHQPCPAPHQPCPAPHQPCPASHQPCPASHQSCPAPHQPCSAPALPCPAPALPRTSPALPRTSPAPHQHCPAPHQPCPASHQSCPAPHQPCPAPALPCPAPHQPCPASHLPCPAPALPRTSPALPCTSPAPPCTSPAPPRTNPAPAPHLPRTNLAPHQPCPAPALPRTSPALPCPAPTLLGTSPPSPQLCLT